MEGKIEDEENKYVVCDINYVGIGSNFRTHFSENEFREIIKDN